MPALHPRVQAIATNLTAMSGLGVPIVTVVVGEGGSGGALGIAMGNRIGGWKVLRTESSAIGTHLQRLDCVLPTLRLLAWSQACCRVRTMA
jgi:hypothetical protein